MTKEEAKQLILEHLDAVQQILDRFDPSRKGSDFTALIDRECERSRITFTLEPFDSFDPILEYNE